MSSSTETPQQYASFVRKGRFCAFSLIEVAIAMGIASFVLISLLGLMTISMSASKRSNEDTTVASLAQTVIAELKTNSFSSLSSTNFDRYFRYDGQSQDGSNGETYFRCYVETSPHTATDLPLAARKPAAGVRARLTFIWSGKTNEIFETTVAKY